VARAGGNLEEEREVRHLAWLANASKPVLSGQSDPRVTPPPAASLRVFPAGRASGNPGGSIRGDREGGGVSGSADRKTVPGIPIRRSGWQRACIPRCWNSRVVTRPPRACRSHYSIPDPRGIG
jgi:hypothetical protein